MPTPSKSTSSIPPDPTPPVPPEVLARPGPLAVTSGKRTYHDSMTGASVTATGVFTDPTRQHEDPISPDRIVADDWPVARRDGQEPTTA